MAKRKGGGRRKPLIVYRTYNVGLSLGALAAGDLISAGLTNNMVQDRFMISWKGIVASRNGTVGQGPIIVGIAHGDYTDDELEECLESTLAVDSGDKVSNEQRRRLVRLAGAFAIIATDEVMDGGRKVTVPLRFMLTEGKPLRVWGYNASGAPLTSGQTISWNGEVFAR